MEPCFNSEARFYLTNMYKPCSYFTEHTIPILKKTVLLMVFQKFVDDFY